MNILKGIFALTPWSCPRGGTWVCRVCPGVKIFFYEHGHVAYQIEGDNEWNRMAVNFSP